MKISNEKSISLTSDQLKELLIELFKDQFSTNSELNIKFSVAAYSDYYDRAVGHKLTGVTITGSEEQDMNKLIGKIK